MGIMITPYMLGSIIPHNHLPTYGDLANHDATNTMVLASFGTRTWDLPGLVNIQKAT